MAVKKVLFANIDFASCALFILVLFNIVKTEGVTDCSIHVHEDLSESQPLLLTNTSPSEFLYPKSFTPSSVKIKEEKKVRLICGDKSEYLICQKKALVRDGSNVELKSILCDQQNLKYTSVPVKKGGCPANVECLSIGFPINLFEFVSTIDLIYLNPGRKRPLWAHTTIVPVIFDRQKRVGENNVYQTSEFFNGITVSMEEIYDKNYQRKRFAEILGDEATAEKYITKEGKTIFQPTGDELVRGLLIDSEDFFYKPQQDSARHYANVMPMWKSIVAGNWRDSGQTIRKLASDTRTSLDLWSGAIGTLELQNAKSAKKSIYMATDSKGDEVVPVPKILFKYAYDRSRNQGIVLLTINNPFLRKLSSDYVICENQPICQQLHPKFKIFPLGYTYCCLLKDFVTTAKLRGLPYFSKAKPLFN